MFDCREVHHATSLKFFKHKVVCCIRLWPSSGRLKIQWPFQDPKLEVATIYKAYFLGLCKGISPQNMALYGTVPPF